jgi:hypothetical protein
MQIRVLTLDRPRSQLSRPLSFVLAGVSRATTILWRSESLSLSDRSELVSLVLRFGLCCVGSTSLLRATPAVQPGIDLYRLQARTARRRSGW